MKWMKFTLEIEKFNIAHGQKCSVSRKVNEEKKIPTNRIDGNRRYYDWTQNCFQK